MSARTDQMFLEIFDSVERRCGEHAHICQLLREATGGTWHANEFELGWTTALALTLEELERRGLLTAAPADVEPP